MLVRAKRRIRRGMLSRRRCCCSGGGGFFLCGTCKIPATNLTISWTNLISGPGSDTLVYNGAGIWQVTNCTIGLIFELRCTGNAPELQVYYFVSGSCPTGGTDYCSNQRFSPFGLVQTSLTCGASFNMQCNTNNCSTLGTLGYLTFTVS